MTKIITRTMSAFAGCSFTAAVALQDTAKESGKLPTAEEVMHKAEQAMKQIKIVQYRFAQRGHGEAAEAPPRLEGRVVLSGYRGHWVERFRVDAKVRKPGESEPVNLVAGSDGDIIYLVDEKQKKVYADIDPAVLGSQMFTILETVVGAFVSPNAFEYEKKAERIELKETTKVGDDECHVLRFQLGGGVNEIVWFIAKKDGLPRRFDWIFKGPTGEPMGASTVLTELRVNPTFDTNPFKLTVPEGFTKTDDFAP